ncbi:MAG: hypothetical protein ACLR43_01405 [Faecalibacillus faecis]
MEMMAPLLKDALVGKNVNIDYLKISNKPTGHAIIEVDQSGQNHILLYGGTNKEIDFEYIDEVLSHFSTVMWLFYKMKSIMYLILSIAVMKRNEDFSMQLLMMNQFKIIQLKK